MKTICKKSIVISIILLLIGVSVSSAYSNVVTKSLITENQPPNPPMIMGQIEIQVGVNYQFSFTSTDPEGDNISFYIEWGDGTSDGWTDYSPSGTDRTFVHKC